MSRQCLDEVERTDIMIIHFLGGRSHCFSLFNRRCYVKAKWHRGNCVNENGNDQWKWQDNFTLSGDRILSWPGLWHRLLFHRGREELADSTFYPLFNLYRRWSKTATVSEGNKLSRLQPTTWNGPMMCRFPREWTRKTADNNFPAESVAIVPSLYYRTLNGLESNRCSLCTVVFR